MTKLKGITRIILKCSLILKNLQNSININNVLLFERYKPNPKPNTVTLTNVVAVTSGKHCDSDTELACFVRLSNLYIT